MATTLTVRYRTADITYCADVMLFLHATSRISYWMRHFVCADFLHFIALNAIWAHFLCAKLRFHQYYTHETRSTRPNWRETARKKKFVFWRESRRAGRSLIIINKSLKETENYYYFINITELFLIIIFCSAVIVLVDFKMYIVSYNSVQNGLVYFYMSVYTCM